MKDDEEDFRDKALRVGYPYLYKTALRLNACVALATGLKDAIRSGEIAAAWQLNNAEKLRRELIALEREVRDMVDDIESGYGEDEA